MLLLTAAIVAAVSVGVWAHGRFGEGAEALTRRLLDAMLYVALPFIVFFVVARAELDTGAGLGLMYGYVGHLVCGTLAYVAARRIFHLGPTGTATMVIGVVMANTGYLGVPLTAALLGADDLGPAVTFDAIVSGPSFYVFGFAVAAALTTRGEPLRDRLARFVSRSPPLVAVLAALVAPDAIAPEVMRDVAEVAVAALLPVGFFVLGVTLCAEAAKGAFAFPPPLSRPVATVVALRMLAAPALLAALSAATVSVPDAYLVQAAMPVGINTLVVAHAYDLDLGMAASAVAWSTAIAVVAGLGTLVV